MKIIKIFRGKTGVKAKNPLIGYVSKKWHAKYGKKGVNGNSVGVLRDVDSTNVDDDISIANNANNANNDEKDEGEIPDINGKSISTDGEIPDINGKSINTEGEIPDINGKSINTDGESMDTNDGVKKAENQGLGGGNSESNDYTIGEDEIQDAAKYEATVIGDYTLVDDDGIVGVHDASRPRNFEEMWVTRTLPRLLLYSVSLLAFAIFLDRLAFLPILESSIANWLLPGDVIDSFNWLLPVQYGAVREVISVDREMSGVFEPYIGTIVNGLQSIGVVQKPAAEVGFFQSMFSLENGVFRYDGNMFGLYTATHAAAAMMHPMLQTSPYFLAPEKTSWLDGYNRMPNESTKWILSMVPVWIEKGWKEQVLARIQSGTASGFLPACAAKSAVSGGGLFGMLSETVKAPEPYYNWYGMKTDTVKLLKGYTIDAIHDAASQIGKEEGDLRKVAALYIIGCLILYILKRLYCSIFS